MNRSQFQALGLLIEADRLYRSLKAANVGVRNDDCRGIEISAKFGIHPLTARALEEAGLIEIVPLPGKQNSWAFLGKLEPLDPVDAPTNEPPQRVVPPRVKLPSPRPTSWKYVFNSDLSQWGIVIKAAAWATASKYPYYMWEGRVYLSDSCQDTGVTLADMEE